MWKLAIAITLAVAVWVDGLSSWDYCWCKNKDFFRYTYNASCRNQTGAKPGEVLICEWETANEYSCMMIDYLVERQNDLRRKVASGKETRGLGGGQPPAANMQQLRWDFKIQKEIATFFIDCRNNFDSTCVHWAKLNGQGYNAMVLHDTMSSTVEAWIETIDYWYREVKYFNSSNIANYKDNVDTGNYTHMMDAQVNSVACGSVLIRETQSPLLKHRILICRYLNKDNDSFGPKPKPKGSPLYEIGKPCSRCPSVGHTKAKCFQKSLCQHAKHNAFLRLNKGEETCVPDHLTVPLELQD